MNGELIGMNSAVTANADGLGFAIPVELAKRIADELIATGHATHAVLGVLVQKGSNVNVAKITKMTSGGAAAAAGLPTGSVITKVDDQSITSPNALVAAVRARAPGTQITLTYLDPSGVTETVQITLGTDQGMQLPRTEDWEIPA